MTIILRITKDLPSGTISRSWIVKTLKRSEEFVRKLEIKTFSTVR